MSNLTATRPTSTVSDRSRTVRGSLVAIGELVEHARALAEDNPADPALVADLVDLLDQIDGHTASILLAGAR
jgi:hypothetical protein